MPAYSLLRTVYNRTIRDYLPRKYRLYAGVAVRDTPLLDFPEDRPDYKRGLVRGIDRVVQPGDDVCLVGFGRGVSTVRALDAGAEHVTAYEAAEEMIDRGRETVSANRPFSDDVTVEHALVGESVTVYGDASEARRVAPSDLRTEDVLILDCEGAERSILENLETYPRAIVCETHPERGTPKEDLLAIDAFTDQYEIAEFEYTPAAPDEKVVLTAVERE